MHGYHSLVMGHAHLLHKPDLLFPWTPDLEHSHLGFQKSFILHPQKQFYLLYQLILQYTLHPDFYFNIQNIKIILASEHAHAQWLFYFLGKNY